MFRACAKTLTGAVAVCVVLAGVTFAAGRMPALHHEGPSDRRGSSDRGEGEDLEYPTLQGKVTALESHGMVAVDTDDGATYHVKGHEWKVGDTVQCDRFTNGSVSCARVE